MHADRHSSSRGRECEGRGSETDRDRNNRDRNNKRVRQRLWEVKWTETQTMQT